MDLLMTDPNIYFRSQLSNHVPIYIHEICRRAAMLMFEQPIKQFKTFAQKMVDN